MSKTPKQREHKMRIAAARMRKKITNLVNELHHKTALFLVKNFELILLPTFETKTMASDVAAGNLDALASVNSASDKKNRKLKA